MIYTVTLNPSLDLYIHEGDYTYGGTGRLDKEELRAGGKGINVSLVLKNLGHKSVALGFTAGFTGDEIERQLRTAGLDTDFIKASDGNSRVNIKFLDHEGSELNAAGPKPDESSINALLEKIALLDDGDVLILSGSLPCGVDPGLYGRILEVTKRKSIFTALDTSGEALRTSLKSKPYFIKPNISEAAHICGIDIPELKRNMSLEDIKLIHSCALTLKKSGAGNVLISCGAAGAFFLSEDYSAYYAEAPEGIAVNTVGAGDSMTAAFAASRIEGHTLCDSFKFAVAAGSACAFKEGFPSGEEIRAMMGRVKLIDIPDV